MRVIAAAHAFIPGQLNLAHAAATYLPADVHCRLSNLFGQPAVLATGLDVHGRGAQQQLTNFSNLDEMAAAYETKFRDDLASLGIIPDLFLRTDDARLGPLIEIAVDALNRAGLLELRPSRTMACGGCGRDLSKGEVVVELAGKSRRVSLKSYGRSMPASGDGLVCNHCGGAINIVEAQQWNLKLLRGADLAELHERQPTAALRRALRGVREGDFANWEITRDRYLGPSMPLDRAKSLYVWFAALLLKLLLFEGGLDGSGQGFGSHGMTCFFGKNILPYYAIVLPLLIDKVAGNGAPDLLYSVRGFCDVDSTASLLSLDRALSIASRDEIRLLCLYCAPDDIRDFSLAPDQLKVVKETVIRKVFARFLAESKKYLDANPLFDTGHKPPAILHELVGLNKTAQVRRVLLRLEEFTKDELERLRTLNVDPQRVSSVRKLVLDVIECYMPTFALEHRHRCDQQWCQNQVP